MIYLFFTHSHLSLSLMDTQRVANVYTISRLQCFIPLARNLNLFCFVLLFQTLVDHLCRGVTYVDPSNIRTTRKKHRLWLDRKQGEPWFWYRSTINFRDKSLWEFMEGVLLSSRSAVHHLEETPKIVVPWVTVPLNGPKSCILRGFSWMFHQL